MSVNVDGFLVPEPRGQHVACAPFDDASGAVYAYDLRLRLGVRWRCVVVYGPERPALFPLSRRAVRRAIEEVEAVNEPGDMARLARDGEELLVTGTEHPFKVAVTCRGSLCGAEAFSSEMYRAPLLHALRTLV